MAENRQYDHEYKVQAVKLACTQSTVEKPAAFLHFYFKNLYFRV